mmetsp:Transcript_21875/g.49518  ORF Transcript_21875/g.49518 Transcript_21875/m.49518 type:complete len:206 (-) Transcript_21875:680-1297(-)
MKVQLANRLRIVTRRGLQRLPQLRKLGDVAAEPRHGMAVQRRVERVQGGDALPVLEPQLLPLLARPRTHLRRPRRTISRQRPSQGIQRGQRGGKCLSSWVGGSVVGAVHEARQQQSGCGQLLLQAHAEERVHGLLRENQHLRVHGCISVGEGVRTQHARLHVAVLGQRHVGLEADSRPLPLADLQELWPYVEGVAVRVVPRVEPA